MSKKGILFSTLFFLILIHGCAVRPDFKTAEFLFNEIVRAENPYNTSVLSYNWESMDMLGDAFAQKPDTMRAHALFSNFFIVVYKLEPHIYSLRSIRALEEYGANLLRCVPQNGVFVTASDQAWFSALYAQKILGVRGEVPVLNTHLLPFKKYRIYISAKFSISIPDSIKTANSIIDPTFMNSMDRSSNWLGTDLGRPIFYDTSVETGLRPLKGEVVLGLGRVYGMNIDEEKAKELNLDLYANKLKYDIVSDTNVVWPPLVHGFLQWYGEAPLYNLMKWWAEDDARASESLVVILLNKIPAHWQPAYFYVYFHPEFDRETRAIYMNKIKRYIKLHPESGNAKSAYQNLYYPEWDSAK